MNKKLNRQLANKFINKNINNIKGKGFKKRFIDILSDPNNRFISRCPKAGQVINGNIVMHNGLIVPEKCYYGAFSKIFVMNKGVHEPAEERMFAEVLQYVPSGGTIIELGAYWAFYSMWFAKTIPNAKVFCVEPEELRLNVGKANFKLNNLNGHFTQGEIGTENSISLLNLIKDNKIDFIDILHSDIQGSELNMLNEISSLLDEKRIGYLFVSSHTQELHHSCINVLKNHGYRIIASADFDNETFCWDGIIVSCPEENKEIPYTSLGCRKHTPLRKQYVLD